MLRTLFSKSKYLRGLQCPKLLWLTCHEPEKVPAPDASTQHIFDQGHLVGGLAKKLFPAGIDIPCDDFIGNLNQTKGLLNERVPLFEAGFMKDSLFSRLDILNPVGQSAWDIIEVKGSTSVKEENYQDVAFQKLCVEKQGITINKCFLAYLNNRYVKNGEIDSAQFFKMEDITAGVEAAAEGLNDRISSLFEVISSQECPEVRVGSHCSAPYECPVTLCWEQMHPNNIFQLYRGGQKCFDLYYQGISFIKDIPENIKLNRAQEIQKRCEITGTSHIEKGPIAEFLGKLQPPEHYLDFETINPAVPLFDGTRPFQKVPFQFSLHVLERTGQMRHESFLAEVPGDPRLHFLNRLKDSLSPGGSIVTYNQAFEEGILKELAESFPEYAGWVEGVRERLVDLWKPFQSFQYYHPHQNGSASIKHVLPALTGRGYESLTIGDGDTASLTFLNVIFGEATEAERQKVRADLEQYCGLDTEAMIQIVAKLREAV